MPGRRSKGRPRRNLCPSPPRVRRFARRVRSGLDRPGAEGSFTTGTAALVRPQAGTGWTSARAPWGGGGMEEPAPKGEGVGGFEWARPRLYTLLAQMLARPPAAALLAE